MNTRNLVVALAVLVTSFGVGVGRAQASPIVIAGVTYDSTNFADSLISSLGSFTFNGATLASSVTGTSVDDWAFSLDRPSYVELGFTDNTAVNGAGADLVFFEIGTPDNFGISLTPGGPSVTISSISSGFVQAGGFGINVATLDLSSLGVAPGASISSLVVNMGPAFAATATAPTLGAVVALDSSATPVPEPASLMLLASGLAAASARKFRQSARRL